MRKIDELLIYTKTQENGDITGEVRKKIIEILEAGAWNELACSTINKTTPDKLWRAEEMRLEFPCIIFKLERHAGTVNGSTRAALHCWQIDLVKKDAKIVKITHRKIKPISKKYNAKKQAEDISSVIINQENMKYLTWNDSKTEVRIMISKIITGYKQSVQSQRKKFRIEIEQILLSHGWARKERGNTLSFEKVDRLN